jgi:hypothetical protein
MTDRALRILEFSPEYKAEIDRFKAEGHDHSELWRNISRSFFGAQAKLLHQLFEG